MCMCVSVYAWVQCMWHLCICRPGCFSSVVVASPSLLPSFEARFLTDLKHKRLDQLATNYDPTCLCVFSTGVTRTCYQGLQVQATMPSSVPFFFFFSTWFVELKLRFLCLWCSHSTNWTIFPAKVKQNKQQQNKTKRFKNFFKSTSYS